MENKALNVEIQELSGDQPSSFTAEMKSKRLESLFGDPNLKIEDIVKPIGEKELKEKVDKLRKEKEDLLKKDDQSATIQELEKELKKSKNEYEDVMKEIQKMRQEQVGRIL